MKNINTAKKFGRIIKETRKALALTQKDLAAACGTGVRFIQDLEKGKVTCELGKAFLVARMLGIVIVASIPNHQSQAEPNGTK